MTASVLHKCYWLLFGLGEQDRKWAHQEALYHPVGYDRQCVLQRQGIGRRKHRAKESNLGWLTQRRIAVIAPGQNAVVVAATHHQTDKTPTKAAIELGKPWL